MLLVPAIGVALFALGVVLASSPSIMKRRLHPGRCAGCGYSTRGLSTEVCPECGAEFEASRRRQRRKALVFTISGTVLMIVGPASCVSYGVWLVDGMAEHNWSSHQTEAAERRGNEIVAALDAFEKARGVYPGSLRELVPGYIDRIGRAPAGIGRWLYTPTGGRTRFRLECPANRHRYPTMWYDSVDRRWRYDM